MTSVTTAVPSGAIGDWCIHNLRQGAFADLGNPGCANETRGTTDSDFETICCDGDIVDTTADLYRHSGNLTLDLANLVCCRIIGDQQGGLLPIQSNDGRSCTEGTPTPLASLAATNTKNAAIYPVTYTSASGEAPNIGDFLFTQTPVCLWANTKSVAGMSDATVQAAHISSLPVGWPDPSNPLILSAYPTPVATADVISGPFTGFPTSDATIDASSDISMSPTSTTSLDSRTTSVATSAPTPTSTTSTTSSSQHLGKPNRQALLALCIGFALMLAAF